MNRRLPSPRLVIAFVLLVAGAAAGGSLQAPPVHLIEALFLVEHVASGNALFRLRFWRATWTLSQGIKQSFDPFASHNSGGAATP